MNVYGIYLATLHQQDLIEQARDYHRAKLAPAKPDTVSAWRKRLSGFLGSAASTIDPTVKVERVAPAC